MSGLTFASNLKTYQVTAYNYATTHSNRIHADDVAAEFGFSGGLVTGVAIYAYLVHPVLEAAGRDFLESAAVKARFLSPIYDGELVTVVLETTGPKSCETSIHDDSGILRAVAQMSFPSDTAHPTSSDYPYRGELTEAERPDAAIRNLPTGHVLSSLAWKLNLREIEEKFLADMREDLPLFRGDKAVYHPACLLAQANEMLIRNCKLGPWIHTGSDVVHHAIPGDGASLSLRGVVGNAFEKKGHELVTLHLALFEDDTRPIASIRHTAIIRLRPLL